MTLNECARLMRCLFLFAREEEVALILLMVFCP